FTVARFPTDELKDIDQIVVANEVAEARPRIYGLMKRYKVAAIVPFHPHSQAAASWMLLGEAFSNEVYSPRDFKNVEALFARLADHFLDKQLLLRNQLAEAQEEMRALQRRLALAWHQLNETRKKLSVVEEENLALRQRDEHMLQHDLQRLDEEVLGRTPDGSKTLTDYMTQFEAKLLAKTLEYCSNDDARAAEILGLPLLTFHYKLRQHRLAGYKKLASQD
ncbi:MAG: helix-turn-helix domain-containing protein, partial [Sulfurifustis sp.]